MSPIFRNLFPILSVGRMGAKQKEFRLLHCALGYSGRRNIGSYKEKQILGMSTNELLRQRWPRLVTIQSEKTIQPIFMEEEKTRFEKQLLCYKYYPLSTTIHVKHYILMHCGLNAFSPLTPTIILSEVIIIVYFMIPLAVITEELAKIGVTLRMVIVTFNRRLRSR